MAAPTRRSDSRNLRSMRGPTPEVPQAQLQVGGSKPWAPCLQAGLLAEHRVPGGRRRCRIRGWDGSIAGVGEPGLRLPCSRARTGARTHAPSAARAAGGAQGPRGLALGLEDPRADSDWRLPVGGSAPGTSGRDKVRARKARQCRAKAPPNRSCQCQRAASYCDFHAPGLQTSCERPVSWQPAGLMRPVQNLNLKLTRGLGVTRRASKQAGLGLLTEIDIRL